MSFFSQDFICTKCEEVQEQIVTNQEHDAEDPCNKCGAAPEKLERKISATGKHVTWSLWRSME